MSAMVEDRRLVDYLLGRLPEAERGEIERRLFAEDDLNDELRATLDDLIHAYLAGALPADDRARFEAEVLASPGHRQRVAFMKDVLAAVDRLPASELNLPKGAAAGRPSRGWRLAAAVAVLALAALAWLLFHPQAPAPVRTVVQPPPPPIVQPAPSPQPSVETATVQRVRLPAHGAVDIPLTEHTRTVRLEVPVPQRPGFDAVIRTAAGAPAWRARGIPPPEPGHPLVLTVPATALGAGRYRLRVEAEALRGSAPAAAVVLEYELRVVR
jgi:hypothetical protein